MEDYPRDLTEFEARFANEAACRDYLFRLRWPDGFRCPRCGGAGAGAFRSVLLGGAAGGDYLFRLGWRGGLRGPRCGGSGAWLLGSVLLGSAACRYQTSVTAGTI